MYVLVLIVLVFIPSDQHRGLVYRILKLLSFFSIIPSYLMSRVPSEFEVVQ